MRVVRIIRRFASSGKKRGFSKLNHRDSLTKAYYGVQAFYAVNTLLAYQLMYLLMDSYGQIKTGLIATDPLWPVYFLNDDNLPIVTNAVSIFYMIASLCGALWPHLRGVRILLFISMLQAVALKNSFGIISQKEYWWMWVAFILTFLPSSPIRTLIQSRNKRQLYLDVFSIAQGFTLLWYTISGIWKVYYGIILFSRRQPGGIFSENTLSNILATVQIKGGNETFLGPFLINNPSIAFWCYLLITYVEIVAILVWLRPDLHRIWGVMLILFHVGTWLTMGIVFYLQPPLLTILFLMSPFALDAASWKTIFKQIPGIYLVSVIRIFFVCRINNLYHRNS